MGDITLSEKKQIIEFKQKNVAQGIYSAIIDKRVADNCSDKNMLENAVNELKRLERMKDAYATELKAVEAEIEKEKAATAAPEEKQAA